MSNKTTNANVNNTYVNMYLNIPIIVFIKLIKLQVGFRSVEEKKSLEILLKDRPYDKAKLKYFCLRFTVPVIHRNFVWKLLLGITPIYTESDEFIAKQRKMEFHDLRGALNKTKIVNETTKPHQVYLTMWLLRTRRAKIEMTTQLETPLFR